MTDTKLTRLEERVCEELNSLLDASTDHKKISQSIDRFGGILCKHGASVSDAQQKVIDHLSRRIARRNASIKNLQFSLNKLLDTLKDREKKNE